MSRVDINSHEVEVKCESGHANKVTIGDVRAKKRFKCRGCDQMISLKPDANFDREIRELQKALDDFGKLGR